MNKEEVINKIKKMLRLATNKGATENEAYVAMQQAQKLAIQHGLPLGNISLSEEKPQQESITKEYIMDFTYSNIYNRTLLSIIAKNFRCEILVLHGAHYVRGVFVGTETDVAIAKEVAISAYHFMEKRAKEHSMINKEWSKKSMNSYRLGFLDGLQSKYKDNLSKLRKEYPEAVRLDGEYGLVVVKPESLVEFMKPYNEKKAYRSNGKRNDMGRVYSSYSCGYYDGQGYGTQIE